jgi:hypothetical protein
LIEETFEPADTERLARLEGLHGHAAAAAARRSARRLEE